MFVYSLGWTRKRIEEKQVFKNFNEGKVTNTRLYLQEGFGYFYASARGRLTGDMDGFVKVLAYNNPYTGEHPIIGVEIFGDGANELIQLASILLQTGATLEQVAATPFAAVTLSGLFQTASDDCLDKFADSAKFADATCEASAPSSG